MTYAASIAFIVDNDISVRESLELLIRKAGRQPETFETALEFLSRPHILGGFFAREPLRETTPARPGMGGGSI